MEVSQPDVTENQPDFIINIISTNGTTLHSLKFEGNTACLKWKYAVKQAVTNFSAWKQACNEIMYIQEVKKRRLSIPTTASFYDQIKTSDITSKFVSFLSSSFCVDEFLFSGKVRYSFLLFGRMD